MPLFQMFGLVRYDNAQSAARARSPSPAQRFENELSALVRQLSENPGELASLVQDVSSSPGVPPTSCAASAPASTSEQAALDILAEFDDFPAAPEPEPTHDDVDRLRKTTEREKKAYRDAQRMEKAKNWHSRTAMQVLYDRERDRRGCARGACCVYSMWYDPEFGGHGNCTHKCTVSHGAIARCGPSLFALDLPPLHYPGDTGGNDDRDVRWAPPTVKGVRSKRRAVSRSSQGGHPRTQVAIQHDETRDDYCFAALAGKNSRRGQRGSKRDGANLSTIQAVRNGVGQSKKRRGETRAKVLYELPTLVGRNDKRNASRSSVHYVPASQERQAAGATAAPHSTHSDVD